MAMSPEELDALLAQRESQVEGIMAQQMGVDNPDVVSGAAPPVDPAAQLRSRLDERYKQVSTVMKQDGIGDPEEDIGAVQNSLNAFWNKAADTLGLPVEAVNQALGWAGANFMEKHDAQRAIKGFFNKLGIRTDAQEGVSKRFGENTFEGAVMLGGLFAAAGKMAARAGTGVVDTVIRNFGEALKQRPGLAAVTELGSAYGSAAMGEAATDKTVSGPTVGGVAGFLGGGAIGARATPGGFLPKAAGTLAGAVAGGFGGYLGSEAVLPEGTEVPLEPIAEIGGAFAGGLGVAGAEAAMRSAGRTVSGATNRLLGRETGVPLQTDPVLDLDAARSPILKNFTEEQVRGAQLQMEDGIERALEGIQVQVTRRGQRMSGPEAAVRLRNAIEKEYQNARAIERDFWEHTPLSTRISGRTILRDIDILAEELNANSAQAFIPTKNINEVRIRLSPKQDPETGQWVSTKPSVKQLRAYVTDLAEDIAREPQNTALNRNRARLQDIILNGIEEQMPDNIPVRQARAMSTKLNDLFTRGPIGDVRALNGRDVVVPPGETTKFLMSQFEGIESALNVSRDMGRIPRRLRQPDAYRFHTRSVATRADHDALRAEVENSIRAAIRDEADAQGGGPQAAAKYIIRHERNIAPLGREATELSRTADYINAHLENKQVIGRSTLARFTQFDDADKAITWLWNSPKPRTAAREIMHAIQGNPEAIEAFQHGVVKRALDATRSDPIRMRQVLDTPRFRDMMSEVLTDDQMRRLNKMTDVAISIARGDESSVRAALVGRVTFLGQLIGAMVGRQVGTGTIQVPGHFSRTFGAAAERLFHTTDPAHMFAFGVVDPRWERLLLMRQPTSTKEFRAFNRQLRRIISGMEGVREAIQTEDRNESDIPRITVNPGAYSND